MVVVAPFLEVLQYQVNARSGRSKLLFHFLVPQIHLMYCPQTEEVSDIKLRRTDTTLALSQKAEKQADILILSDSGTQGQYIQLSQIYIPQSALLRVSYTQ